MRYEQIIPDVLTEHQELMEVKMTAGTLKKFIDSDKSEGIVAGFEAEMIFPNLREYSDYESEPDYDADKRARSISDVVEFFDNDDRNTRRDLRLLEEWLEEQFAEWRDNEISGEWTDDGLEWFSDWFAKENPKDFKLENQLESAKNLMLDDDISETDADRIIKTYMSKVRDNATESEQQDIKTANEYLDQVNEMLNDEVLDAWRSKGRLYDRAREQWLEEHDDEYTEREFFQSIRKEWMQELGDWYTNETNNDLEWPYWTDVNDDDDTYNYAAATELADKLSSVLKMPVQANQGYHGSRPDDTWVIEPDGSLSGDNEEDMPAEIISPPMPIKKCLEKLRVFMYWASKQNAYTNSSTGFHVGVSLPNQGSNVDYIKLALFLGDKFVLEAFDRVSNHYAESALKIITNRVEENQVDVEQAFTAMRKNLLDLASKAIREHATDKYESINIKPNYIEFRSMGGEDYEKDVNSLISTISRYAYAMYLAGNKNLEREEYAKKMYKLLSGDKPNDVIRLFSDFSAGRIDKENLKIKWLESVSKDIQRNTADTRKQGSQLRSQTLDRVYNSLPKYFYRISDTYNGRYTDPVVSGISADDAYARAVRAIPSLAVPRNQLNIKQVYPFMVSYAGPEDESEFTRYYTREQFKKEYPEAFDTPSKYPSIALWAADANDAERYFVDASFHRASGRLHDYSKFNVQLLSEPTRHQMVSLGRPFSPKP